MTRCTGCGLVLAGGTQACQALFDWELPTRSTDVRYARMHRMAVDAYCLQHPDRYCVSAKSLAAHLMGLCVALECPDPPSLLPATQRWLNGNPALTKPPLPRDRGELTILSILDVREPEAFAEAVQRWAHSTWQAYEPLHPLAREWIGRGTGTGAARDRADT